MWVWCPAANLLVLGVAMQEPIKDPLFRVEAVRTTANPQQAIYMAAHQDYAEEFVCDRLDKIPDEATCGDRVVKLLLQGNRGHYGCLEHPQIQLNVGYFPHSVMQQLRTHRIGISMDVQSMRFSGKRIVEVAEGAIDVESVFYLRPVGHYSNRQGKRYFYSGEARSQDVEWCRAAAVRYADRMADGVSEEHARGLIPFDFRQHFMVSCNLRSLMHILDLRAKADAQLEIQTLCHHMWTHFETWTPAIAQWYTKHRLSKARLSP